MNKNNKLQLTAFFLLKKKTTKKQKKKKTPTANLPYTTQPCLKPFFPQLTPPCLFMHQLLSSLSCCYL